MAHLQLVLGPMYAGKTTSLIQWASTHDAIILRPQIDTRTRNVESHQGLNGEKGLEYQNCKYISSLVEWSNSYELNAHQYIGIDEGQFIDDLYEGLSILLKNKKSILVSALSGDYLCRPFDVISRCISIADTIVFKKAKCMKCFEEKKDVPAPFTKRFELEKNNSLICIGNEPYMPVCRKHYLL